MLPFIGLKIYILKGQSHYSIIDHPKHSATFPSNKNPEYKILKETTETPALQQNWQSSEKSQNLKEKKQNI